VRPMSGQREQSIPNGSRLRQVSTADH